MVTVVSEILPYMAIAIFVLGSAYRILGWARAPKKLNWKLYPVPQGMVGEAAYILEEWISFKMLFRNNRALWLGSYAFHLSLAGIGLWLVLLLVGLSLPWLVRICTVGILLSSSYLFIARLWIPQIRVLSSPVEFFNLALFIAISALGLSIMGQGLAGQFRSWALGLLSLKPVSLPEDGNLLLCLLLVEFTVAYLPFSKMFHAASKYFAFHKSRWLNPYELRH